MTTLHQDLKMFNRNYLPIPIEHLPNFDLPEVHTKLFDFKHK